MICWVALETQMLIKHLASVHTLKAKSLRSRCSHLSWIAASSAEHSNSFIHHFDRCQQHIFLTVSSGPLSRKAILRVISEAHLGFPSSRKVWLLESRLTDDFICLSVNWSGWEICSNVVSQKGPASQKIYRIAGGRYLVVKRKKECIQSHQTGLSYLTSAKLLLKGTSRVKAA